jgi:hypothetical protein
VAVGLGVLEQLAGVEIAILFGGDRTAIAITLIGVDVVVVAVLVELDLPVEVLDLFGGRLVAIAVLEDLRIVAGAAGQLLGPGLVVAAALLDVDDAAQLVLLVGEGKVAVARLPGGGLVAGTQRLAGLCGVALVVLALGDLAVGLVQLFAVGV